MGIYRVVFILYVYGMVAPNKSKYEKAKKALVKDVYDKESLRDVATYYFDSKDYE